MTIPDVAIGGIAAAIITALITFLGLIISKENKTSEFRQAWIDALRADFSSLLAHLHALRGTIKVLGITPESWKEARPDIVAVNQALSGIRLRLNPTEKQSKTIFVLLDSLEAKFKPGEALIDCDFGGLEKELIKEAQVFLKTEWKRVRSGELVFRIALSLSIMLVAAGLVIVVAWLLQI
jgi:hypothetical protein